MATGKDGPVVLPKTNRVSTNHGWEQSMPDLICVGFGRTGTDSLRSALEILGFGPCHHMRVLFEDPMEMQRWRDIAKDPNPDWDSVFSGWRSLVDWPSARYWRETTTHFPDAKVILTLRSPESWWNSFARTIGKMIEADNDPASVRNTIIDRDIFEGRALDRDHALSKFEQHNAEVAKTIPGKRLLELELGTGWEPLCAHLDVAVPDIPYPSSNDTNAFHAIDRSLTRVRKAAAVHDRIDA